MNEIQVMIKTQVIMLIITGVTYVGIYKHPPIYVYLCACVFIWAYIKWKSAKSKGLLKSLWGDFVNISKLHMGDLVTGQQLKCVTKMSASPWWSGLLKCGETGYSRLFLFLHCMLCLESWPWCLWGCRQVCEPSGSCGATICVCGDL